MTCRTIFCGRSTTNFGTFFSILLFFSVISCKSRQEAFCPNNVLAIIEREKSGIQEGSINPKAKATLESVVYECFESLVTVSNSNQIPVVTYNITANIDMEVLERTNNTWYKFTARILLLTENGTVVEDRQMQVEHGFRSVGQHRIKKTEKIVLDPEIAKRIRQISVAWEYQ